MVNVTITKKRILSKPIITDEDVADHLESLFLTNEFMRNLPSRNPVSPTFQNDEEAFNRNATQYKTIATKLRSKTALDIVELEFVLRILRDYKMIEEVSKGFGDGNGPSQGLIEYINKLESLL